MDNVLNTTEREYYFVNEDSAHLKWIAFIGNLIGGYVVQDFDIVIRQHMNYDAGTDRLYEIIMAAFNDATFKKSDLDEKIEEYRRTGTEEESQYPCKNGVVYISVGESNTSDYYISVIQCVR